MIRSGPGYFFFLLKGKDAESGKEVKRKALFFCFGGSGLAGLDPGVAERVFQEDADPEVCAREMGFTGLAGASSLRETIGKIFTENPKSVRDYQEGKKRALGFLVGQTMKALKGAADPAEVPAKDRRSRIMPASLSGTRMWPAGLR